MKKLLGILLLLGVFSVYAANNNILCSIEYFYSDDGMLIGKAINGNRINYEYDLRGQLLSVKDTNGKVLESYTYDRVGNILSKTVNDKTTTYTYDKANQLISSTIDGKTTNYKYDAAGRMVQAGSKTYRYKYLDKVAEVRENGKVIAEFEYTVEGQVSTATYGDKTEEFMWDGLSLIKRNDISYINEPYVTGGNPIIADNDIMFNDMLGNTVAINGKSVDMTAFGETENNDAMFTGKPHVAELGYAFLSRNYNSSLGKWSTSDPLGYPDGWNNFAYCGNNVTHCVDFYGAWGADVHYTINESLCGEYIEIKWYNSEVDILDELNDGSDAVDSIWNQVFGNEFEHGMRNVDQTVEEARIAWDKFITDCVQQARALSDKGRKNQNVKDIKKALELLGKAIHALADSYSPSHSGFQEWNPPYWKIIPVPKTEDFWNYVEQHTDMETFADYETMQDIVNNAIINKFRADLLYIIKE